LTPRAVIPCIFLENLTFGGYISCSGYTQLIPNDILYSKFLTKRPTIVESPITNTATTPKEELGSTPIDGNMILNKI
jgi:hypothetical protein